MEKEDGRQSFEQDPIKSTVFKEITAAERKLRPLLKPGFQLRTVWDRNLQTLYLNQHLYEFFYVEL